MSNQARFKRLSVATCSVALLAGALLAGAATPAAATPATAAPAAATPAAASPAAASPAAASPAAASPAAAHVASESKPKTKPKPQPVPVAGTFAYRAFQLPSGDMIHGAIHAVVRIPGGTAVFYSVGGPGNDSGATMPHIGLSSLYRPMAAWAVGIVDAKDMTYYIPLATAAHDCLCSDVSDISVTHATPNIGWAVLPPLPKRLTRVTVSFGFGTQITNVPVTSTLPKPTVDKPAVTLGNGWPKLPNTKTIKAADAAASTRPLTSNVADPEATTHQSDTNVSIALNADVLFAVDQSDLSPQAQQTLKDTAANINKNAHGVVSIVGYTDDTGTAEHNQTLSEARAQSVLNALKPLVTNPDVTLQASGMGEQDPVADNGTDAGRQLNRRVTVTMSTKGAK
jgi:outer membrane protein OmpA-like peptidoglycan-associated protein